MEAVVEAEVEANGSPSDRGIIREALFVCGGEKAAVRRPARPRSLRAAAQNNIITRMDLTPSVCDCK